MWRCAIFAVPFVAMSLIELFVLPIQAFSFRLWEPLTAQSGPMRPPGPFLPNMKAAMREQGDLAHGSKWAVAKEVYWETDARGFRNRQDMPLDRAEVVVVGDSMIAGSSLTQADRLTDQMTEVLHTTSYAYAPSRLDTALADLAAHQIRPKTIVFESIERTLTRLPGLPDSLPRPAPASDWLVLNRLLHPKFVGYFQAEWHRFRLGYPPQGLVFSGSNMVFLEGERANREVSDTDVQKVVERVTDYQRRVEQLGMSFVFLPIPNKETIYYDLLPSRLNTHFLHDVIGGTQRRHVATVDSVAALENARREQPDRLLYHLDDSHWNAAGVQVVLGALKPFLQ